MKILLCPNGYTGEQAEQAVNCLSVLEKSGHYCALLEEDSYKLFGDGSYIRFTPTESEVIVSLGGDGSVLRAAQTAIRYEKPLIGINSGRLGYLCAINYSDIGDFDEVLASCEYHRRMLLECDYGGKTYYALNDIVIAKKNFGETVDLSLSLDGGDNFRIRGDGLIIATPTGSTAYNLSAGGPVVSPDAHSFVVTPVCSHTAEAHPIVMGDGHVLSVTERNNRAELLADGQRIGKLDGKVDVRKSSRTLYLCSKGSFFSNVIRFS